MSGCIGEVVQRKPNGGKDVTTISRSAIGPLSLLILLLVVTASFYRDYGSTDHYPLILNPKFKYFTKDALTGQQRPFLWETTYTTGPNDMAFIRRDLVDGKECLGLHIYQDGANDTYTWATIHVKQAIRGEAASRLLKSRIDMLVYPTFNFVQDPFSEEPWNVFGLEINDGKHMIWFIFSEGKSGVYQLRNHRIVLITTPLNQWSHVQIDVGDQYLQAGWEKPSDLSLILICGATKMTPGQYAGFYKELGVVQISD